MISRDANKMIILCVLQLITDKWQMLKFYTICLSEVKTLTTKITVLDLGITTV